MATRSRRSSSSRKRPARRRKTAAARRARARTNRPTRARAARKRPSRRSAAGPARAKRPTRRPARSRPSRRRVGSMAARERPPSELDFEAGNERTGRGGDARTVGEQREAYPPRRVREAGLTGGETPQRDRITADDAAPDTLLDDEGGQNPADQRGPRSADTALSVVDESAIGAGGGRDEAEDAEVDPISREEHRRLRKRVARSGGDLANLEPNESLAGSPGRERNRDSE